MKTNLIGTYFVLLLGFATTALTAECVAPPAGIVSWWPGEDNANDIIGDNPGAVRNGALFSSGLVGAAFSFNGANGEVFIPGSTTLNVGAENEFTFEGWIFTTGATSASYLESGGPLVEYFQGLHFWQYADAGEPASYFETQLYAALAFIDGSPGGFKARDAVTRHAWHHVALTYSKPTGVARIYADGAMQGSLTTGSHTPTTTGDLYIGRRSYGDTATFNGLIDEMTLYKRALSESEIKSIYEAGSSGKCKGPSFANFTPRAEFTLGPKANDDSYWVRGWLKLAGTSNGIDPLTETVTVKVGPFSHTLPAGSFTQEGDSYVFKGPVGASVLDVRITGSSTPGGYSFKSCLKKADLEGTTLKPDVQLTIGDDSGQATLDVGYGKFGKGVDGQKWVFPPVE